MLEFLSAPCLSWNRIPEGYIWSGFITWGYALPRGEHRSNCDLSAHRGKNCYLCKCLQLCSSTVQTCFLFPDVFIQDLVQGYEVECSSLHLLGWSWGSGRCSCRNWSDYTAAGKVGCLVSSFLPGSLHSRSSTKLWYGVSEARVFTPFDRGVRWGSHYQCKTHSTLVVASQPCMLSS